MELIAARADRVNGGVVFHSEEFHALRLPGGFAGFGDTSGVFGRNEDRRRGVRRGCHLHCEFSAIAFPVADDAAVGRVVVALHSSDVANDGGLDDGVFKAGCGGVRLDAKRLLPIMEPSAMVCRSPAPFFRKTDAG